MENKQYKYTTNTLRENSFYSQQTVSSGIRPVNEKGKFCGPVFVRVKTWANRRDELEATMKHLVQELNSGNIKESDFARKSFTLDNVQNLLTVLGGDGENGE